MDVYYTAKAPALGDNIDIGGERGALGGGTRAAVEKIDGDTITVFTEWGDNVELRVRVLTPEQAAFVDLVRDSMITGFLHLTSKLDQVKRASATCGPDESAHDVLSRVLGAEPVSFIAVRPFEVIEVIEKLEKLR